MTDVTEDDVGKPIYTAEERHVGTLRAIDHPTLYIELADDIDDELRSDMKVSETTAKRHDGEVLAGAPRAAVEGVTADEIHFWPSYAAEASHESVSYDEIPEEDGHEGRGP